MPRLLQDEKRDYKRYRHDVTEKKTLIQKGFQHVLSSNVSAVKREEDDLIIRFHNGSVYRYPGSGDLYQKMLSSNSKGKFVWSQLRRKHVPYYKVGKLSLPSDTYLTDAEIFDDIDANIKAFMDNLIGEVPIHTSLVTDPITGLQFYKYTINGVEVLTPINIPFAGKHQGVTYNIPTHRLPGIKLYK